MQAALTGHLVLTTFHAGSAAASLSRLLDMGIEPYILRSALRLIIFQRLARALCPECSRPSSTPAERLGLDLPTARSPVGCPACRGTGYAGRLVLAESLAPDRGNLAQAILARADLETLQNAAIEDGLTTAAHHARLAVATGRTSPAEIIRVLGLDALRPA